MAILTDEQRSDFERDGFLLVSGLIPADVSAKAEAAIWTAMGADPSAPSSWEGKPWSFGVSDPDALAVFTPELAQAVDELSGEPCPHVKPPTSAFAINVFPQIGRWRHHGPHIDHALEKDGFEVFPRPMRLASLLYLTDCRRDGATTVVWPGSHAKIEALARSDPERYRLMSTLNQALGELDLGKEIQVKGKRGDVLLYHYLCAHSGSKNARDYPRFAFAHKGKKNNESVHCRVDFSDSMSRPCLRAEAAKRRGETATYDAQSLRRPPATRAAETRRTNDGRRKPGRFLGNG